MYMIKVCGLWYNV